MRRILPILSTIFFLSGLAFYSATFTSCYTVGSDSTKPGLGTTISGKVYDNTGFPFKGVKVHASPTNFTTTLADGSFLLSNISYPVTLIVTKDGDTTISVFQGLNANNPQLTYNTYGENNNSNFGQFHITYPAVPVGKSLLIKFASEDIVAFDYVYSDADSISANVDMRWQGDKNTVLGKLILMVVQKNGTSPVRYDSYAEKTFYVDSKRIISANYTAGDFSFNPDEAIVNVRNFNFSQSSENNIYMSLAGNTNSDLFLDNLSYVGGTHEFIVPKVFTTNRFRVTASSPYGDYNYIQNNAFCPENYILTLSGIPELALLLPIDNAKAVDSTADFKITGNTTANGVYVYDFQIEGNFFYSVKLYSNLQEFKYPDLSAYGFNLRRGQNYTWTAQKISPFGNLDDYLSAPVNKILKNYNIQTNLSHFKTAP